MVVNVDLAYRPHILAIDNDPMILNLYRLVLEAAGYRVSVQAYRERSVAAIATLAPDLLIADYLWSNPAGGLDFLEQVRAEAATALTPVLVCTTAVRTVAGIENRLRELRVTVLIKPFFLDEFRTAVRHALTYQSVPMSIVVPRWRMDQPTRE